MLKITYLSHSGFLLDDGTHKLAIDPFLSGNDMAVHKLSDFKCDYIALTHAHGDHYGDTNEIAMRNDATVIAVNELANFVSQQGLKAHNMHIGGSHEFEFGRIKFTIAHHGSSSDEGKYMGEPAGIVVNMGGVTVYHAGDTGLFLDMKLIGELDAIDLALLPIGDNFTMGIDDAVKAAIFLDAKLCVPIHYDTFPVIEQNPNEFVRKMESIGKKAKVMKPGDTLEL